MTCCLALGAFGAANASAASTQGAVISNGTVQLGVNALGDLNYDCARNEADPSVCPPPSIENTRPVGLRFVPLNSDGTAPGCLCEGWGAADAGSGLTGFANKAGGDGNVTVASFDASADGTSAISVVDIADSTKPGYGMRVQQDYHPSARDIHAYEDTVTITNTGTNAITDLRYRRAMDWDTEPTAFNEWVTIAGSSAQLLFDSDDGFASSDPLSGPSYIDSETVCGTSYTGVCNFTDLGSGGTYPTVTQPDDHGALFDFGFGVIAPGESKRFTVFYGATPDEATALSTVSTVGAEVYSLGETSCPDNNGGGSTTLSTRSAAAQHLAGVRQRRTLTPRDGTSDCSSEPPNSGVEHGTPVTYIFGFVTATADLATTATAPATAVVGDNVTINLNVHNNGPDQGRGVLLTDQLPSNAELVSATPSQGSCSGNPTLVCDLGTVPPGADVPIQVVVKALSSGDLTNTGTVSAASRDPEPANDSATTTTKVAAQAVKAAEASSCARTRLILTDVLASSRRVSFLGSADPALKGQSVRIVFGATGKTVATTKIAGDGSFKTSAALPKPSLRKSNRARYTAVVGKEKSRPRKLLRRLTVSSASSSGGKVTIRGRVLGPLATPRKPVTVKQRISCTQSKVVATVTPSADGTFTATFDAPTGTSKAIFVLYSRVRATPGSSKLFPTKSLPRPVKIG